ncbi:MAG: hypothetical protein MJ185_03945 [Treponema sp.]|nr:hypothetical protein [Treponema sp.]
MNKSEQENNFDRKRYFYGTPEGDEEFLLDILSKTDVKSFKTSSIPLTEFWLSRNKKISRQLLDKIDPAIDFDSAVKCFEYPVYATKNDNGKEKRIGLPSMTDLMLFTEKYAVAVEGKFTEPLYETIEKWLLKKSEKSEKPEVLESWYKYIEPYCNYKETDKTKIESKVVYQFLHRTASACYCSKRDSKIPVVLYHLFYDKDNERSKRDQEYVAKKIEESAELLGFNSDKIKLIIELTPVTNFNEVKERYDGIKGDLFIRMKRKEIYRFE